MNQIKLRSKVLQFVEITIGVLCIVIAFYFFFLPNDLVTGGITGLSIIFDDFIKPSVFIFIGNAICLAIGLFFLGKSFFIKTIYGTILLPLVTFIFENTIKATYFMDQISNPTSKLLISVFLGGSLAAIGLGLCFRNNATTGGMDIIQKVLSKLLKIPYSKAVYLTDGVIVAIAFFTLKLELTFYGVIAIVLIGYLVDIISIGGKITRTVYIITKNPDQLRDTIYSHLQRGVTYCNVTGGYSQESYTMLIVTLSKNESYKLKELITQIDKTAFTFVSQTKEVIGDGF